MNKVFPVLTIRHYWTSLDIKRLCHIVCAQQGQGSGKSGSGFKEMMLKFSVTTMVFHTKNRESVGDFRKLPQIKGPYKK